MTHDNDAASLLWGTMSQRSGNRPIRRIARADTFDAAELKSLARRMVYVGSAHHKRSPGDYGFHPPVSPRPWKSLCDGTGRF